MVALILLTATPLHLYLDETVESQIVDIALREAGMQDDVALLDDNTLVFVYREPRSLLDYPEGPLCAFSRYETPHQLCFWKRVTCCELCLFNARKRIIEHLIYKAAYYRRMKMARRIYENSEWYYRQPLVNAPYWTFRYYRINVTLWLAVPSIQSFPPVPPAAKLTVSQTSPAYMDTGKEMVEEIIKLMETLAYE